MSVNLLGIARLNQQKETQKRNSINDLMNLFEQNALRYDTNEEYDVAINNIQKLQGQDQFMDVIGNERIKKLELEKQYNDELKAWNTKADSVYNQIKTKDIEKTDFLDLMNDLRDNGIRVSGKSTKAEIQGINDKIENIYNMRKALDVEYDTQLLKGIIQNPQSTLYGTPTQREGAEVLSQLKSESPVEELKAEISSNIFSQKDIATRNQRTQKKIDAYGLSYFIGKKGEGMNQMDKSLQHHEVTADIIGKLNKRVGTFNFSVPLTFATEKAGDTKVNRSSKYFPNARKQMAKSYLMPFFTTTDFREVYDDHINKILLTKYTEEDINAARGGQINTQQRRQIAQELAIFDESAISDNFIETSINLMDQFTPEDKYNKYFSKMIRDKNGKIATTERTELSPAMHESYKALKENYFNWKKLSDEYTKINPDLQSQPNVIPDKYQNYNAVDIDQFKEMLGPE